VGLGGKGLTGRTKKWKGEENKRNSNPFPAVNEGDGNEGGKVGVENTSIYRQHGKKGEKTSFDNKLGVGSEEGLCEKLA